MTSHRLPTGGTSIDRSRTVRFLHDGRALSGFAGDTLASAMLANGRRLAARSFKVHRPRGIFSAGPEEPCALLTVGEGARATPNCKAPTVPLTDGLVARSQNAWPSLRHDAMSLNALGGHALAAGFYYKTFISGTARRWTKLFEPAIRRAAGMGAATLLPDPDRTETAHRHCDLLVVGAGPAGLAAARAAAQGGLDVVIADERERFGGALLHDGGTVDGLPAHEWAAREADALAAMGVTCLPRTAVYGHYDGQFAAVERVTEHLAASERGDLPRERHWLLRPARTVLACGAIERPIVHANNDRPGIMLADAARCYLNAHAVAPGRRVTVHANNASAYRAVRDLHAAAVEVVAIVDARASVSAAERAVAQAAGAELILRSGVRDTTGRLALTGIRVGALDGSGPSRRIACDTLLVSGGWTPTLHLTSQAGGAPVWDERLAAHRPGALPDTWDAVGAMDGAFATADCLLAGARAGARAAREGSRTMPAPAPVPAPAPATVQASPDLVGDVPRPVWFVPNGAGDRPKSAFVDLQHDVTAADIALARSEGFEAVEHLKRYTTLGMATDQGKTSNAVGLAVMAELTGQTIPKTGTTIFRPPASPVAIGAFAGHARGRDFRPTRLTPTHDWARERGAVFVEAGQWLRAQYFPRPDEAHWRQTVDREVLAVRDGVGVCDVSTLGKIDVQGLDAAAFLNRVYANGFATLPVGKCRYGLMLREDGIVMDDGTVARLDEHHYVVTTTPANAGSVFRHMEFVRQCLWPELDVHLISTTEAWAQIAVAGPRSRDLLERLVDPGHDISDAAFPYLACGPVTVRGGVPARLFRLSFSGERAFEIAVPARYGDALMRALMEAGEDLGVTAYGTEALGVMRIEKGHPAGNELDGRTTARDLGLGRMVSTKKDAIGAVLSRRDGLSSDDGHDLVGLVPVDRTAPLVAGAHLLSASDPRDMAHDQGWTSSACHSPMLGHSIALGFLRGGRGRMGERLIAANPLEGRDVEVEVVSPHFFDPDGDRLRG